MVKCRLLLFVNPYIASLCIYSNRGRRDPNVLKVIGLSASTDPPDWSRTLQAAQKAKDLGIIMAVMTRGEEVVNVDNFRKLSTGGHMTWFGEKEHLRNMHTLMDGGNLCRLLKVSRDLVRKPISSFRIDTKIYY